MSARGVAHWLHYLREQGQERRRDAGRKVHPKSVLQPAGAHVCAPVWWGDLTARLCHAALHAALQAATGGPHPPLLSPSSPPPLPSPCRVLYDRATQLWTLLFSVLGCLPRQSSRGRDMRGALFWSSHQRFFKGLLIAAKVRRPMRSLV